MGLLLTKKLKPIHNQVLFGGQTVQSLAQRSPGSRLGFLCATVIQINIII